jgi:hypothetical protein
MGFHLVSTVLEAGGVGGGERSGLLSADAAPGPGRPVAAGPGGPAEDGSFSVREALRTRALWLLSADTVVGGIFGAGMGFHLVSIVQEAAAAGGHAVDVAVCVYIPAGLGEAGSSLLAGLLLDRGLPVQRVLAVANVLTATAVYNLPSVSSCARAAAFGLVYGVMNGSRGTTAAVIYAKFFGRRELGAIQSTNMFFGIAGSALGPLVLALAREELGEFAAVLRGLAFVPLVIAVVEMALLRPPRRRRDP